jgi:prepilin-type N-terminal cleavage/methylation domain-containing protein
MKRLLNHKERRFQKGFTLIEVIIAISILSVMVTLNYQMLRGIVTAKELIEDRRDAMYIANSLLTRLSRELQLAVAIPGRSLFNCPDGPVSAPPPQNQGAGPARYLIAESDERGATIQFMAKGAGQQTADASGQTGVVMLKYSMQQDPERRSERDAPLALVRSETPSSGQILRDCGKEIHFPVTNNLVAFSLRFYDNRTKSWTPNWDEQRSGKLPVIIEFTVSLLSPKGNLFTATSAVRVTSAE